MLKRLMLVSLASLILLSYDLWAQADDYKMKSIFIVRFAKYIEWPSNYKSGDFTIGVLGSEELRQAIESTVQGKTVGSQKMVVKQFNSASEVQPCNILYIAFSKSSNFYSVSSKLKNSPTLIVTEKEGLAQKGSNINLVMNDGKIAFEINKNTTEKSGLKVPASLLSLATVY